MSDKKEVTEDLLNKPPLSQTTTPQKQSLILTTPNKQADDTIPVSPKPKEEPIKTIQGSPEYVRKSVESLDIKPLDDIPPNPYLQKSAPYLAPTQTNRTQISRTSVSPNPDTTNRTKNITISNPQLSTSRSPQPTPIKQPIISRTVVANNQSVSPTP
jgi:hypothetical protein